MVSREEALESIVISSREDEDEGKQNQLIDASARAVEVSGRKKYFDLRDTWSKWIINWITSLIIFNSVVTIALGFGWLDYKDYEWFITAVLIQTFLQIVGLGTLAVAYLFNDGSRGL